MKKFKILWLYLWQQPWLLTISLVFTIIGTLLYSAQPYFVGRLTDAATSGDFNTLRQTVIWLLLSIFFSVVLFLFSTHLGYKSISRTSVKILYEVMAKIHDLDFSYHTNKSSGKILSLINRGDDAVFVFSDALYFEFSEILIGFIFMFFSFVRLDWKYALTVALAFTLILWLCLWIMKINIKARSQFNKADTNLTAAKVDNLISFETVKYFAREKFELKRFKELAQKWKETLIHYFFTFRFFDGVIGFGFVIFLITVFTFALNDLQRGVFGVGDLLFVMTFALGFKWRMDSFVNILRHVSRKSEDLEKYLEILTLEPKIKDPPQPLTIKDLKGEIVFDHVSFSYDGKEEQALKDINLKIKPGEVVALVGFSGAGKTTVVKLLQRMFDVDKGAITIDGVNLKEMKREYLRNLIGIVPQDSVMFNNTVKYNLSYADPEASDKEVKAAAKAAKADEFIEKLADKYETQVGERGIKLSGGQRQRLAIARVLLKKPALVVFDEATSSLDSESEQAIAKSFWHYVREGKKKVTAIIIAHRLSTIMRADRIVVMSGGQIAEIGSHQELLQKKGSIYGKLWQLQSNGFIGDGETDATAHCVDCP